MPLNRWRLEGQTALITGASRGIGLACARELLLLGADVLMVARDPDHLERVRVELEEEFPAREVRAVAADLSQAEQRLEVYDWIADLGAELQILVNNVGGNAPRPTLSYSDDDVRALIENNVISAFAMARLAHPLLTRHAATAVRSAERVRAACRAGEVPPQAKAAAEVDSARLVFDAVKILQSMDALPDAARWRNGTAPEEWYDESRFAG